MTASSRAEPVQETVAVVVVTYNRADLLERCLAALASSHRVPDRVFVVDNASSDRTPALLHEVRHEARLPVEILRSEHNLGGAGGFLRGVAAAYSGGYDRIWLMDDDVLPAPDCLDVLMSSSRPALMAVREDRQGRVCEKAATIFDLSSPWAIRPKREMVEDRYPDRSTMPAEVPIENVAFEGFMVRREVVRDVGLPDGGFFIFYDDVDFALRTRRAGYPIAALRDAVLVRQLDFDQQHDMRGWKGYYMYRNLFVVHRRYGANLLVRWKPLIITLAVLLLAPLRGGRAEADNVWRAWRDSFALARTSPPSAPLDSPPPERADPVAGPNPEEHPS
jgi:rhamnopyranosyl-N-acetylglucosaminyl-diphospho-decaprenol beta-1,3/1,4-galactofuranosyltransferase